MSLWVIPFIGNILRYNDAFASHPPFALTTLISIIMTSQCAVDCLLFSIREKPWRHIPGSKGGFWESLAFWRVGDGRLASLDSGPGKSRAEMAAEARAAYRRRDEEIAARISETGQHVTGDSGRERVERSWWDTSTGIDGMASPAVEEIDPFEVRGNGS
jgi:G protein-coupled receptor GPR1